MEKIRIFVIALMSGLQLGCSGHVAKQDLYGRYEARTQNASVTLILKHDMTYWQEVRFDDGRKLTASGMWKYPSDLDDDKFELFYVYFLGNDTVRKDHDFAIPVTKTLGIVELAANPGRGISYRRMGPEK